MDKNDSNTVATKDERHPLSEMLDLIAKYVPYGEEWGLAELGKVLEGHILWEWQFQLTPGNVVMSFERDDREHDLEVAFFKILERDEEEITRHVENIQNGNLERTGQKKYMEPGFYHLATRLSEFCPDGSKVTELLPMWECHCRILEGLFETFLREGLPRRPEQFIQYMIAVGLFQGGEQVKKEMTESKTQAREN